MVNLGYLFFEALVKAGSFDSRLATNEEGNIKGGYYRSMLNDVLEGGRWGGARIEVGTEWENILCDMTQMVMLICL